MLLGDLSWPEVKALPLGSMIVMLPTGSFEQHGPHLPFTVDTDLVTAVARGVEQRLAGNVLLLPTLWPGMSTHHNAFPGTIDVPAAFMGGKSDGRYSLPMYYYQKSSGNAAATGRAEATSRQCPPAGSPSTRRRTRAAPASPINRPTAITRSARLGATRICGAD